MDVENLELFAWVGEDEFGSGKIGIKQALVPAGMIPMVAIEQSKMDQDYIRNGMDIQGKTYGKKILLCRFKFDGIVREVGQST